MNTTLFVLNLAATVALLVVTLITGKRGLKLLHIRIALTTVVVLLLAVVQADMYGHGFTFEDLELKVHLIFAFATLFAVLPVIYSGYHLRRESRWRHTHARFVTLFVCLTVAAVLTAGYMFLHAVPVEAVV